MAVNSNRGKRRFAYADPPYPGQAKRHYGKDGWQRDDVYCAVEGCDEPVVGYDAESSEHYCAKHEGPW